MPARLGRRRRPPPSRRRGAGTARRRQVHRTGGDGDRCVPPRPAVRSGGWPRRDGSGDAGGAAHRRGARRARGRDGIDSPCSPARRSTPRAHRRGGRTLPLPAAPTRRRTRRCRTTNRRSPPAGAPPASQERCHRSCWRRAPAPIAARWPRGGRARSPRTGCPDRVPRSVRPVRARVQRRGGRRASRCRSRRAVRARARSHRGGRSGSGASPPVCRSAAPADG